MKSISIKRNVYAMASQDGQSAEITMYGDIYENLPRDWWTGEPIKGQFITLETFLEDLEQIQECISITIRMNSYGGDAGASNTIHNRLRELARSGVETRCIVDGAAMSGGSLIMSACDTVIANPSSLIMIHLCWNFFWGGYNANELRKAADENDAWDKMQVECYKRKTGMSDEEILGMMAETTYMTGREAMEKGFVNELLEDVEPTNIAASANGNCLFVNGCKMHLAPGMTLPQGIPMVNSEENSSATTNTTEPATTGDNEGGTNMANTPNEPKVETPAAAPQTAAVETPQTPAASAVDPVQAERTRIQEIDDIAHLFSPDLVKEAKYGEKSCSAQELAFRAAQAAASNGKAFMTALTNDNTESGAQSVQATAASEGEDNDDNLTPAQRMARGRASAKATMNKED